MSLPTPPVIMPCPVCGEQQRITSLGTNMRDDDLNIYEAFVQCPTHGWFVWRPEAESQRPRNPSLARRLRQRLLLDRRGSRY
jgi:hypothetical protein